MKLIAFFAVYLLRYIRFLLRAKTVYRLHSPFVYDLANAVLQDNRHYYIFSDIHALREHLLSDDRMLTVRDYGAGSKVMPGLSRRISHIARYSAISDGAGRRLFRLIRRYRPQYMLELGTSLGISTLYQAAAAPHSTLITVEGCPETAAVALENFRQMGCSNINLVNRSFHEALPAVLEKLPQLDYLFLDGDHTYEGTLSCFETCLPKATPDSIFVLADIHWSGDMEKAWRALKAHPNVRLSVDLFELGLLFFRKEFRDKEEYALLRC